MNRRALSATWLSAAVLLTSGAARADDVKERCARASEHAQTIRLEGKLYTAKKELLVCAQPECPGVVAHDCVQWLAEVEAGVPSVVLSATDGAGRDLTDVSVAVDGTVTAQTITGKELELDPGPHTFVFETPEHLRAEQKLVIRVGERRRSVAVKLEPATAHRSGTSGRKVASYVLFGVGVLGVSSFSFFGIEAKNRFDTLQSTCGHRCSSADVSDVRTRATVADVSLGVGLVAIGVGAFLFLTDPSSSAATSTGARSWNGAAF